MSNALHNCIKEKQRLYKLSLSDMNYLPIYKRYRNILTNALRKAKSIHYSNKFKSCSRDAKSTWKVINSLLHGREDKGKDLVLRINNEEIAVPNLVGNEFNNYFSSVASSLASTIPPVDFDPLIRVQRLENTFVCCDVTAEEVHKTILSFKSKMSSINDIPT